jgi:type I restriction enzyme, S subunit
MGKVSDVCNVNINTLSIKDEIDEINYIEISEVKKGIIKNIYTYKRGEEPSRAKRKLTHGDIALSTVRPNRGSYFLSIYPEKKLIASTGFAVFSPTSVPYSFLYCFLTDDEQIEYYGRMADGAAYPAINSSVIMNIDIINPSADVLQLFNDVVENLYLRINENLNENKVLTQLRDSLLPKLMTGKIEIL